MLMKRELTTIACLARRFVGLLSLMCVCVSSSVASETVGMNIIVFLVDDLGWKDLGCYGSDYYRTPTFDTLAAEGVRFTDAYSACAVCSPTRAAIMTGKYPARNLMTNWIPDGRWDPSSPLREARFLRALPLEEITIAEALKAAGYRTAHVGKWHLGGPPFSLPEHHGFDINIAGNAHGAPGDYFFPYPGDWSIPTTPLRATWNVLDDGEPDEYLTERLTEEAVAFIRAHRSEPFFLHFAHYAVHTPLQARPEMVAKYQEIPAEERQGDPVYAAMVESVDDSLKRLVETLDELGLSEKTALLVASDNGGMWKATNHAPLRGHKGTYWEGGIRTPLIIKWPGVAIPGHVVSDPVTSSDLYPTMLSMAGQPLRPHQHADGVDLHPVLAGNGSLPTRSLFWHFPHYNNHPETVPCGTIRKGNWKLIESYDPVGLQLYDLSNDLEEQHDLSLKRPDKLHELQQELDQWRVDVRADMMQPNPDHDPAKFSLSGKAKKKKKRSK